MFRRKSQEPPEAAEAVCVVDGVRIVTTFELARSAEEDEAVLRQAAEAETRRRELDESASRRALQNLVSARQERNGIVTFNRLMFGGSLYVEVRRWLNGSRSVSVFAATSRWEYSLDLKRSR